MEAGGDVSKGANFPTRTCEGYDANDGAAWGGEKEEGGRRVQRKASVCVRRRVQRKASVCVRRTCGIARRKPSKGASAACGGKEGGRRAAGAAQGKRLCSADPRDRTAAALELRRGRVRWRGRRKLGGGLQYGLQAALWRRLLRLWSCCSWERQDGLVGQAPHYFRSGAWPFRHERRPGDCVW